MNSTETNEKSEVSQPTSVCSDIGHTCENVSMNSFSSRNTEATAAYFIQQVVL